MAPASPQAPNAIELRELPQTTDGPAQEENTEDDDYPSKWKLVTITIGLCLSIFLAALDSTIIAQAIPALTDQFGSISNIAWYGTAYNITNTAFQSAWGKAYKYWKLKPVYLSAIVVFEVGNIICAAAQSSNVVVFGRVVAGIGGGGIMTGSFIIIAFTAKPQYRAAYMGVLGVTFGCASVVGPLLGGALVDYLNWRWVFLVFLPIGAVAAGIMGFFFSQPRAVVPQEAKLPEKLLNMDLNGGVLVAGSISCFILAMHYSKPHVWGSAQVVGSLVGFAGLAILFVVNEKFMGSKAMIQAHLLKKFSIVTNSLFLTFVAGLYFPLLFILPIEFQSVHNNSASESGVRLIPLVLGISIFTMVSNGALTWWRHYSPLLVVGAVAGTAGVSLIYSLDATASSGTWTGLLIVTAIGIGLSLQIPMIANQAAVGAADIPAATSLTLFMENIGTSLFVAAGEAAFTNGLISGVQSRLPSVDPSTIVNAGVTQLRTRFSATELPAILAAYLEGCQISHVVSVACGSAATLMALTSAAPGTKQGLQNWWKKSHSR
ncbi:hypothetical protein M409DRAFT_51473 [Zasmidium cellare ATCC 36951]|uniref:Major facilitator superfamily (MFS) profile domain-containing protein n=1 Tax=Zasmidium cellare ATCC 36951 TaxID=1080233 RepID=A0A6A6CW60_ZASCE|nr:uncharacterized protein M409DRAFT_51473 [Zasmidium cellare ATCC 36951]KAF2170430.1 hypothetical protein M409DRAFT_51473 [Zasmidium cellare ATCC 36951]